MENPVEISELYLKSVRDNRQSDISDAKDELSDLTIQKLHNQMTTESAKKAFWTNLYNARVRERINMDEINLRSFFQRFSFFYRTRINICSKSISLQTVEHRILRAGQASFGLGYINIPSVSTFIKESRPDSLDYRIHFLLNCGAKSCPQVRILNQDNFDRISSEATSSYLRENVETEDGTIKIPRIFLWYRGDFGGRNGIIEILNKHTEYNIASSDDISYRDYDWSTANEVDVF